MFQRRQKKSKSKPQPVLINPTHLDDRTQQLLSELIEKPQSLAKIYLSGATYYLTEKKPAASAKEKKLACQLTHSMVRLNRQSVLDPAFGVTAQAYSLADMTGCYQLTGMLYHHLEGFQYQAALQSHYLIVFEKPINPCEMTEQHSRLLASILYAAFRQQHSICFFSAGESSLELNDEAGNKYTIHLHLTHAILARERENYPDEIRYEVLGESVGAGGLGEVYKTIKTLIPQSNGTLEGKLLPRKVKHIHYNTSMTIEEENLEYVYSRLTPHLHVKRIVRNANHVEAGAFMVGRLMPGHTLNSYFGDEVSQSIYSASFRWKISSAVLATYPDQVTIANIKHRDINGNNILLDVESSIFPQVFIIDYSFSEPLHEVSSKACGTPLYAAPEVYEGRNITMAADYYSLGVVLAKIWNLIECNEERVPSLQVLKLRMRKKYGNAKGFTPELCDEVANVMGDLLAPAARFRATPFYALKRIDELRIQFMSAQLPPVVGKAVATANLQAAELRAKLRKLFSSAHHEGWRIACVVDAVAVALQPCGHQSIVVEEFIATLGMAVFRKADSCKAILEKAVDIASDYTRAKFAQLDFLQALNDVILHQTFGRMNPDYQDYLLALQGTIARHAKISPRSFDEVAALTAKAKKDADVIRQELLFLRRADPFNLATQCPLRPWRCFQPPRTLSDLIAESRQRKEAEQPAVEERRFWSFRK